MNRDDEADVAMDDEEKRGNMSNKPEKFKCKTKYMTGGSTTCSRAQIPLCMGCIINEKIDEYEEWLRASMPSVEEICKGIQGELLPFADGEWRNEFPKDDWKWDNKNIKKLSGMAGKAIHELYEKALNTKYKGEKW